LLEESGTPRINKAVLQIIAAEKNLGTDKKGYLHKIVEVSREVELVEQLSYTFLEEWRHWCQLKRLFTI
jgi:hypothetical protein